VATLSASRKRAVVLAGSARLGPMNIDGEAPEPGEDSPRGTGEVLLAVLTGTALAPFVQAIATKAGEDVYDKIRGLLTRKHTEPPAGRIVLADPATRLILRLPPTLPTEEAARIADLRLPRAGRHDWLLVEYREDGSNWTARVVRRPPDDTITVGDES
jgi:hypothetical protein